MPDNDVNSLEKVIMDGIGAISKTAESAADLLEELVKKGSLTVEQGKTLNEELKHEIKESINEATRAVQSTAVSKFVENMDKFSPEDIAKIRSKVDELENMKGEQTDE